MTARQTGQHKRGWRNRIVGQGVKPASEFVAHPLNWRIHPKAQQDALSGVLEEVGWVQNVIESANSGYLLDGHARIALALREGDDTPVPFVAVDVSEQEEAKIIATLDPISAMAAADKAKLDELLREVDTGSTALQEMLGELAAKSGLEYGQPEAVEDPGAQIDRAEELRGKWGTERGQLWEIPSATVPGKSHRLLCGDSTSAEDVARLMGGEKVRIVVTSPPYAEQRDYKTAQLDWLALLSGTIDRVFAALASPGDVLVNLGMAHADGRVNRYWEPWLEHCESEGMPLYGWYVWDKGHGFPGEWNGRLAPAHEFVFHFSRGHVSANKWIVTTGESAKRGTSGARFRRKDGSLAPVTSPDKIGQAFKVPDSIIRVTREMTRGVHTQVHPATYPVEFPAFLLQTWSVAGDMAYDPFLGSGTTMVAAEQLARSCVGCEIAPEYIAVALERLAGMGLEPRLA